MRFGDSLARAQLKPLAPRDRADDA
jgi:hypothetical protein